MNCKLVPSSLRSRTGRGGVFLPGRRVTAEPEVYDKSGMRLHRHAYNSRRVGKYPVLCKYGLHYYGGAMQGLICSGSHIDTCNDTLVEVTPVGGVLATLPKRACLTLDVGYVMPSPVYEGVAVFKATCDLILRFLEFMCVNKEAFSSSEEWAYRGDGGGYKITPDSAAAAAEYVSKLKDMKSTAWRSIDTTYNSRLPMGIMDLATARDHLQKVKRERAKPFVAVNSWWGRNDVEVFQPKKLQMATCRSNILFVLELAKAIGVFSNMHIYLGGDSKHGNKLAGPANAVMLFTPEEEMNALIGYEEMKDYPRVVCGEDWRYDI